VCLISALSLNRLYTYIEEEQVEMPRYTYITSVVGLMVIILCGSGLGNLGILGVVLLEEEQITCCANRWLALNEECGIPLGYWQ
jgi:hypothetical protein